jgi:hypothetical protein
MTGTRHTLRDDLIGSRVEIKKCWETKRMAHLQKLELELVSIGEFSSVVRVVGNKNFSLLHKDLVSQGENRLELITVSAIKYHKDDCALNGFEFTIANAVINEAQEVEIEIREEEIELRKAA